MNSIYEDFWYKGCDGTKLYARIYPNRNGNMAECVDTSGSTGEKSDVTLLCMHGLTRNSKDFDGIAEALSQHYSLIVVDQRGRGKSSWSDPSTYTPMIYMRDMFKLLEALKKSEVMVIGTSMGGIIAMLMAATKPKLIKGVVLNDVGPEVDKSGVEKIKGYIGKNRSVPSWEMAETCCQSSYGGGFPEYTDKDWKTFARRLYTEKSKTEIVLDYDPAIDDVVKNNASSTVPPDLWSLFHSLDNKPLMVVRGENSDILSAQCLKKMLSGNTHSISRGLTVRNRAHAPMLDEEESKRAILEYLTAVTKQKVRQIKPANRRGAGLLWRSFLVRAYLRMRYKLCT